MRISDDEWLAACAALLFRSSGCEEASFEVIGRDGRARALSLVVDGAVPFCVVVERVREQLAAREPPKVRVAFAAVDAPLPEHLELSLSITAGGLRCEVSKAHRAAASAPRLLEQLERLAREGALAPDEPIGRLPLLGDEERAQLLALLANLGDEHPRELCVQHLVERHAALRPGDVAAIFPTLAGEVSLSYRELDERADAVADALYRKGVVRDELVGIYTTRSPAMLAALLGVLKAGAAYLPLDPAFPSERLAMMVDDGEVRFLLTERSLASSAPRGPRALVLEELLRAAPEAPAPPPVEHDPEQLAYTLFTSGSTGRPKGVMIPHRAVVNFLATMARRPGLAASERLLALTTLSFDISVLELLLPLSVGATVVIAAREDAVRPARIAELLERYDVGVMQATPATWRMLVESGWPGREQLRALCGGEALPPELANELLARVGELWNLYGPTETTVWSTCARVERDEPVTIGTPIGNTTLYIVDGRGQLVPLGVAGELLIGGDGVALGYKGREGLTKERFIDDPFRGAGKVYQTGDIARALDDGRVELLGRADQQVKIRGFRIELGEIEVALGRVAGVRQAVVVARDEGDGMKRLVAYLRPAGERPPTDDELRRELKQRLPDYMVPAAFVFMSELPMTPNGKIDRRRLPDPTAVPRSASLPHDDEPLSELERRLVKLFEEVLRVWPLSPQERFFDLGGDSLLAVRLFARIEEELGVRLNADALLEAPDAASLAHLIGGKSVKDARAFYVEVQPGDARPPVFCISGIGGHAIVFRALAQGLDPGRRFLGLRWPGLDGAGEPHDDVVELARYFVRKIDETFGEPRPILVGYSFGGLVAYEMAVELEKRGTPAALLALVDTPGPQRSVVTEKLTRLSVHWNNLQKRHVADKAAYAMRWVRLGLSRLLKRSEGYYELAEDRGEGTERMRRVVKAHDRALARYQPRPFDGNATLFRAVSLPFRIEARQDPRYGWGPLLGHRLDVIELASPHMEMLHEPYVDELVPAFGRVLAQADAALAGRPPLRRAS